MKAISKSLSQIHTAVFLFGLAGLFGKLIPLPSAIIVWGRVFLAALFLLLVLLGMKQRLKLKQAKDYFTLGLLGILLAIHWVAFFQAVKIATVAVGLLSYSTFPVFTALLAPYLLKEKIHWPEILMALITFGGVALVVPEFEVSNRITQGILWGMISGLTFAILSLLNRKSVREYPALVISFYQDSVATIILSPFLLIYPPVFHLKTLLLLVLLGVACTAVAHSLFIAGLAKVKAQTASIIASLEPVYGIIFALLILQETPTLRVLLGGVVILGSSFYVTVKSRNPD